MTDHTDSAGPARTAPGGRAEGHPGAEFADLVCADSRFLQVEFDAIIAANYPPGAGGLEPRPPRPHGRATTGDRPVPTAGRGPGSSHVASTGPGADREPSARQRGPPAPRVELSRHARRR